MNALLQLVQDSDSPDDPFRQLAEHWPGIVAIFDLDGRPTWRNRAAVRHDVGAIAGTFGASPAALMAWAQVLEGRGPAGTLTVELPDAGASLRSWSLRFVPLPADRGLHSVACLLTAHQAAEERLETALEIARSGAWEVHVPTGQVWYSDGYYRLCGADIQTARATPDFWRTRVHPDDLESVLAAFDDYAHGRSRTFDTEYRLQHGDGRWLWLLDRSRTVERDANGLPVRVIGFLVDITERRAAEQALRDSEERFRLATDAVNGVIYETDLASGTTTLHGLDRFFGISDASAMPRTTEAWLQMVHADDRDRVRRSILTARANGLRYDDLSYRVIRPDGSTMHVWARGSFVRDASGRAVRGIGLIEDVTARVRAEEALRASEFRFRAVANLTPGFVFEGVRPGETDDSLIFTTETFDAVMGSSYAEFVARGGWDKFCREPDRGRWREALARLRAGSAVDIDLHGVTPAGRDTWLRLQAVSLDDPGTQAGTGAIGVVHDITEAKRAELALHESRLVMKTIIDSSATHLALFDPDHRCVFANYTLHGGPVSDVLGRRIYDFMPEQYHAEIRANFDRVLRTGHGIDSENEMLLDGHEPMTIEMRLRPVQSEGKVVGIVTNIVNVTDLHRQRENLHIQARIIETIRDGVALLDQGGRILLANPALHALFGHAPGALTDRNLRSLSTLSPTAFDRLLETMRDELAVADSSQTEFEGVCADGQRLVATCIFASIELRGERRIVAVLSDISERKRLEREMLQVATREQQRIGSDLHDGLGQQLTGIALLLKGLVPRLNKARPAVSRDDIERIVALVNDAIDSTRSLARGLSPVPATGDGLPLALEALARQTRQLHGVDVAVENGLPEQRVIDDHTATHLYRIAQEALGNALRHGHPKQIRVALRAIEGQLELVVRDDGSGFDRRALQSASGLGLKIMRFRAQTMGGDLAVESTPGAGTVIRCHCAARRVAA